MHDIWIFKNNINLLRVKYMLHEINIFIYFCSAKVGKRMSSAAIIGPHSSDRLVWQNAKMPARANKYEYTHTRTHVYKRVPYTQFRFTAIRHLNGLKHTHCASSSRTRAGHNLPLFFHNVAVAVFCANVMENSCGPR